MVKLAKFLKTTTASTLHKNSIQRKEVAKLKLKQEHTEIFLDIKDLHVKYSLKDLYS